MQLCYRLVYKCIDRGFEGFRGFLHATASLDNIARLKINLNYYFNLCNIVFLRQLFILVA